MAQLPNPRFGGRAFLILVTGLLASGFLLPQGLRAQVRGEGPSGVSAEEAEVVGVAREFLAALSQADTALLARMTAPGASIHSVRAVEGGWRMSVVTREAFLQSLGNEEQDLLERMWSPTVKVAGRVAMVWTPYDFHLNGAFSHCGTDIFTLLKGNQGWQVTGITYNVRTEACPPSPLGPPEREKRGGK